MADLRKHAAAATGILHLRDGSEELMYADGPDGEPDLTKPMQIVLYGPGTKQFTRAKAALTNKQMQRLKDKGKIKQTAAEAAEEKSEFLAAVTKDFVNIERDALEAEALFKATYEDIEIGFVADQAYTYVHDWANFTKGSPKP
jgi:hypothetical protein